MNNRMVLLICAVSGVLVSTGAFAEHQRGDAGGFYAYARVVDVRPIVRVVQVSTPRESCWNEQVTHANRGYRHGRSRTPSLLGGIIGGVVGNQFGNGRGNDIMTVAGALLGASIGQDAAYQNASHQPNKYYTTTERRCEVEHVVHEEQRVDGYDVTYKYQGKTFATRMPEDPGDRVRIRVAVTSAY